MMAKASKSPTKKAAGKAKPKATPAGLRRKVREVLAECGGVMPERDPSSPGSVALREAIQRAFARELDEKATSDLWFHLADWTWEMEFLLALFCRPERFRPAEIREGISSFLLHAPPHINEAARIAHLDLAELWSSSLPRRSASGTPERGS